MALVMSVCREFHSAWGKASFTSAKGNLWDTILWQVLGNRFPRSASHKSANSADMASSLIRSALGAGLTFPSTPVYPNKPGGFA